MTHTFCSSAYAYSNSAIFWTTSSPSKILVDLLTYIAYSIQIIDDRELDKFLTDCLKLVRILCFNFIISFGGFLQTFTNEITTLSNALIDSLKIDLLGLLTWIPWMKELDTKQ